MHLQKTLILAVQIHYKSPLSSYVVVLDPLSRKGSSVRELVLSKTMALLILKLSLVEIPVLVCHHAKRHAVQLELAFKNAAVVVHVSAHMLLVLPPSANKNILICVAIAAFALLHTVYHEALVDFPILILDSAATRQSVILQIPFVEGVVPPLVGSSPVLLRLAKLSFENVSVVIKNLSETLGCRILPGSFKFSGVGKDESPKTTLLPIHIVPFIYDSARVIINTVTILLTLFPIAIVAIPVRIPHLALPMLQIVLPPSFVNISVGVPILPVPVFSVPH